MGHVVQTHLLIGLFGVRLSLGNAEMSPDACSHEVDLNVSWAFCLVRFNYLKMVYFR